MDVDEVRIRVLPKTHPRIVESREGVRLLGEIEHYIHVQQALGNWTPVWGGDSVIVALVDTYDALRLYGPALP